MDFIYLFPAATTGTEVPVISSIYEVGTYALALKVTAKLGAQLLLIYSAPSELRGRHPTS